MPLHGDPVCPISGATTNIYRSPLIPYKAVEDNDIQVACVEWIFGLRRGGLFYYLRSKDNYAFFRRDINDMYRRGEFILAPTYKTYLDTMRFVEREDLKNRKVSDRSPRRPVSALAPSSGMYRYVFIPFTKAARALQTEFKMQPQTPDDLNGGIYPLNNRPSPKGSHQFPVIECLAHPFSICSRASKVFSKRSTPLTARWHRLCKAVVELWVYPQIPLPGWFVDEPKYGHDDEELSPSEATGYIMKTPTHPLDPIALLTDDSYVDEHYCRKCAKWALDVPPDAPPPEEDQPLAPYRERRSVRIAKRGRPYPQSSDSSSTSNDSMSDECSGPLPSPTRRGRRALQTCKRDPVKNPPWWAARSGNYPTRTFCSNDWAYFRCNVYLASAAYT